MTSIDRTAYPGFARMVSARELADAFTLVGDEVVWAREKTTTEQHLLALVVWLKCYQRLRYFPQLDEIPDSVVGHIRGLLGLSEKVAAQVEANRTAKRHREFVRDRLGVTYDSAEVRGIAETAIRAAAQIKDNPADLLNVALEELVRKGRELPGYTTLDKIVAKIRTEVNGKVFTAVAARITPAQRTRLTELLRVDPSNRRSEFDRLKAPAKAASIGKFKLRLAHLAALDALGPTEAWLEGVPPGKISHFAGEARVTDVADFNRIGEDKRLTLLASLIHVLRTSARDEVTEMFCKRMAVIHKKGVGTGSRSPPSTSATGGRSPSPWTSTPSPVPCGAGRCGTGGGPGCWPGATWRCACSPTWPRSCVPATSPWSARTPTPTCTRS